MCGIVGYVGNEAARDIIISGLRKLEYRGYDSAGVAFYNDNNIKIYKSVGKIDNLDAKVDSVNYTTGIGHTRWATHGKPCENNSHPHTSSSNLVTVVHNGVIENYIELTNEHLAGYSFYSETDTEVLANLLEQFIFDGMSKNEAITKLIDVVNGSYALAIIFSDDDDSIFVAKNKSPILIGIGKDFNMVGSDALAMISQTNRVLEIHDKEFGKISKDRVTLYDKTGLEIKRESFEISIDESDADKGIYDHYMLKEINDQPTVIRKLLEVYAKDGDVTIDESVLKLFSECSRIHIIAAGTSYFSGLVSQTGLEKLLKKPVSLHISSEFVYDTPLLEDNGLYVFISQSGETADSRAALVKVKNLGFKSFTITNVEGSTLAREADSYMLLHAGREIAVASTKAFVAQLTLLLLIGYSLSDKKSNILSDLSKAANTIENVFTNRLEVDELCKTHLVGQNHCFFIGRGIDAKLSLEAALKLKEITYIHAEGMSAGELKHGSIALIDVDTPVVAFVTQGGVHLNTRSSIKEVEARGAKVLVVSMEKYSNDGDQIIFENVDDLVAPIIAVVYAQLMSYYTALRLNKDIDMPRNLAKSVTVE